MEAGSYIGVPRVDVVGALQLVSFGRAYVRPFGGAFELVTHVASSGARVAAHLPEWTLSVVVGTIID